MKQIENPNIDQNKLRCPDHVEAILHCGHMTVHQVLGKMSREVNASADEVNRSTDWVTKNGRILAENENERIQNENERIQNEASRNEKESDREAKEAERIAKENQRSEDEDKRKNAENARVLAEQQRVTDFNDSQRERTEAFNASEEERAATFNESEQSRTEEFNASEQGRTATFNESEAERDAVFNGKEEKRDQANEAALNAAESISQLALDVDNIKPKDVKDNFDLGITDKEGNVLAKFENGHIKTKNFDSSKNSMSDEDKSKLNDIEEGAQKNDVHTMSFDDLDYGICDEKGNVLAKFENGHIKTKNFDSSKNNNISRNIDCLGDSLTMGWDRTGSWVSELQTMIPSFNVRNFGVGGESTSTIMARQGSGKTVFPNDFVLPHDGTFVTVASGIDSSYLRNIVTNGTVTPLLQLSLSGKTEDELKSIVNPCYIDGISCTMIAEGTASGRNLISSTTTWKIKRNDISTRDTHISKNSSVIFNTENCMCNSDIAIIWVGTNGTTVSSLDSLVGLNKKIVEHLTTKKYIVIGLHHAGKLLSKDDSEVFENNMLKEFGNKFFNIREYCCTNMMIDSGLSSTYTEYDTCPTDLLVDGVHFKPVANVAIAKKIYDIINSLNYLN